MRRTGHLWAWQNSWPCSVRKPGTGAGTEPRTLVPSWHDEIRFPRPESSVAAPRDKRPRKREEVVALAWQESAAG